MLDYLYKNRVMTKYFFYFLLCTFTFCAINAKPIEKFNPPATRAVPVIDTLFGYKIIDNYRWLEDKDNPEVKAWSLAQHQYTLDYINRNYRQYPGMRDEIRAIYDRDNISAPFFSLQGNREFFYKQTRGDKQKKIYTRIGKKEICIFDPVKRDTTGKSAITSFALTKNGDKAAVGIQFQGNEVNTFYIIDTKTGKDLYPPITGLAGWNWTQDEKGAYISERSREMLEKQIPTITYYHKLGDNRKNDIKLLQPAEMKNFASIWDDDETPYTFVEEADFWSNTLYIMPLGHQNISAKKQIWSSKDFKAEPSINKGKIYFKTNDNAPNWKVMVADVANPEYKNWKIFYDEKETVLEDYEITSDYFIALYRKDVLLYADVYDLNGNFVKHLDMPEGETAPLKGMGYRKFNNTITASFAAPNVPSKLYHLDGKTLKWSFYWQDTTIKVDAPDVIVEQKFATSYDGVQVPMFIIRNKNIKLDGNNPVLIYGYGGFNNVVSPGFMGTYLSFIKRGGIYVLTCLRGGGEYGEKWHQDGMLFKKENTIKDMIGCIEFLVNEKYTNPKRIALRGGSNGGILIGGMAVQRPDLFNAAVCAVPLLDMVRYQKFLMGPYWLPEYGSSDKKDELDYILTYSPYHNIRTNVGVPCMMIKAGENDARVDPLHAKKFAAALQNLPGQTEPIFLHIDFESGHGSGQSIDQQIDNVEFELRYIMNGIGM